MCAKLLQTLCDTMDYSPPGSSVHGVLQARMLEWIAVPSSRDLPNPDIKSGSLTSPALADGFFTTNTTWEALFAPKRSVEVLISRTYGDGLIWT